MLTWSANTSIQIYMPYTELWATSIDSLDGNITTWVVISGTVNTSVAGQYTITYTSTDKAGNRSSIVRVVNIFIPTGGAYQPSSLPTTTTTPVTSPVPDASVDTTPNSTDILVDVSDVIFNPTIIDWYCYTRASDFTVSLSNTINVSSEFMSWLQFMYVYNLTKFNSVDDFAPYTNLTREQAAKLFTNFAVNVLCRTPDSSLVADYSDITNADPSLTPSIALAYQLGLMKWGNGQFRPFDTITKAEFNAVLVRMILKSYLDESWPTRYNTYNSVATQVGIITHWAWSQAVSRNDATLMLYRAYRQQEFSLQDIDYTSFVLDNREEFVQ